MNLATSEDATFVLGELFRAHGLPCTLHKGWVCADSRILIAQARVIVQIQQADFTSCQLDVEVRTTQKSVIVESFVGFGATLHQAIAEAIKNFCDGSFHVIFSALTGEPCEHCTIEEWSIGGRLRRVFIGSMITRGTLGETTSPPIEWFATMAQHVETFSLPAGLHWMRFFHADGADIEPTSEALFDNETHNELQKLLASLKWPPSTRYYSVRIFLMFMDV